VKLRIACLLFMMAAVAHAGTTVIHVDTEEGGTVIASGGAVNQKGAVFWNGSKWVSNDTAAHMYFTDLRTGLRLMEYRTTVYQGSQPGTLTFDRGTIQRSLYSYQKSGADGVFSFSAVQYRMHDNITGKDVILRSRGSGAGTANAYFDAYMEDPSGGTVTAIRGDPVWFSYPMSIDDALHWTSATAYKTGDLPSPDADYWFDQNGGSDMGGLTWQFHTATLPVADPALSLGSSFAVYFSYKYMDASNQLQELRFLPYAEGRKSTTLGFRDVGSMAQLASGNYWKTTITLVNHGATAARARLNFFNDVGQPLSLPITYPSLPPADPVLLTSVERSIAPGASFSFATTGPDDVGTVGWAQMLTDGDITGFAVFRQKVHREQEAVVPLETHNTDGYVLWFNNSGDFITGLAVANSSTSAASIPVIVRDESGAQIGSQQILELPAMGHISGALSVIVRDTGGKVGSVEFRTPPGGQISVLGLRFNGISFTTIPVLDRPLQTATAPVSPLLLPAGSGAQLASGHYWETTLTLVNKGTSSARTKVDFFDNPGNPLALPITFPSTPGVPVVMMSTLERTLAPGASLSFSSTGPVSIETVGWARMSTDGDVGGFAIFRQDVDGAQEALVPMEIENPDAWLLWFDNTGTFASGVAVVNNTISQASIDVIVRDEAGAQVGTPQTLVLPGLGHISGALSAIVGNTAGKVGSVEFQTPQEGAITVLGLRFNGVSFTTIPVMPKAVPRTSS
jgi:hypothetical protein